MRRSLILHPAFQCPPVTTIGVDIHRPGPTSLTLRYALTGDVASLRIPPPATPARTDDLWKHTCFEAFLRPAGGDAYYEFNFSPSGQWAAYRFDGYRQAMADAAMIAPPTLALRPTADGLTIDVALDLAGAQDLAGAVALGATAVIETANGATSYWALAHPPGRPDFHHADGFALDLAATGPQ